MGHSKDTGVSAQGRKCPGTRCWRGSEATPLAVATLTVLLRYGDVLEVTKSKSRPVETDAHVILLTRNQLYYP